MVNPFGKILNASYPMFKQMGFKIVRDSDYDTILCSAQNTIALSVERYTPADMQLSFIGEDGEIYPLWMIRLMLDMKQYDRDKRVLRGIRLEYGLRDGSCGMAMFRQGVKLYTTTYLEQATVFLQDHLHRVNFSQEEFTSKLVTYSKHAA